MKEVAGDAGKTFSSAYFSKLRKVTTTAATVDEGEMGSWKQLCDKEGEDVATACHKRIPNIKNPLLEVGDEVPWPKNRYWELKREFWRKVKSTEETTEMKTGGDADEAEAEEFANAFDVAHAATGGYSSSSSVAHTAAESLAHKPIVSAGDAGKEEHAKKLDKTLKDISVAIGEWSRRSCEFEATKVRSNADENTKGGRLERSFVELMGTANALDHALTQLKIRHIGASNPLTNDDLETGKQKCKDLFYYSEAAQEETDSTEWLF